MTLPAPLAELVEDFADVGPKERLQLLLELSEELRQLYRGKGVTEDKQTIAYCRIGERSSHTWFVLTHLLGFGHVRNYDGSWTEWGNTVRVPIVQGSDRG